MQSPNNPLKTKEASKFPLEVLRIGPAERGTKGRETTAKAFGGKLKQLSGMILGGKITSSQGGQALTSSLHSHCPQGTGADPSCAGRQPLGWGVACTAGKRSVKLKQGKDASFGRDFPWPVRFQIMFYYNLLACDRVSGKWDNSDANHHGKKISSGLRKWTEPCWIWQGRTRRQCEVQHVLLWKGRAERKGKCCLVLSNTVIRAAVYWEPTAYQELCVYYLLSLQQIIWNQPYYSYSHQTN